MDAKEISKAVIKRLPRYYRYLGELMEEKVERISSNAVSYTHLDVYKRQEYVPDFQYNKYLQH